MRMGDVSKAKGGTEGKAINYKSLNRFLFCKECKSEPCLIHDFTMRTCGYAIREQTL